MISRCPQIGKLSCGLRRQSAAATALSCWRGVKRSRKAVSRFACHRSPKIYSPRTASLSLTILPMTQVSRLIPRMAPPLLGLRRQSAAATALSYRVSRSPKSGLAPRLPPQSKKIHSPRTASLSLTILLMTQVSRLIPRMAPPLLGLRRQSAAATALSYRVSRSPKSGLAPRLPPQSKKIHSPRTASLSLTILLMTQVSRLIPRMATALLGLRRQSAAATALSCHVNRSLRRKTV